MFDDGNIPNVRLRARTVSEAVTQPIQEHNAELAGFIPKHTPKPIMAPSGTRLSVFMRVSKAQPRHFLDNWINGSPALLTCSLIFLWFVSVLDVYKTRIRRPDVEDARMVYYLYPAPRRHDGGILLQSYGVFQIFMVGTLWEFAWWMTAINMFRKNIVIETLKFYFTKKLCFLHACTLCTIPIILTNSSGDLENVIAYLLLFGGPMVCGYTYTLVVFFVKLSVVTNNLPWCLTAMGFLANIGTQVLMYDILFATSLLQLGELPKAAFVVVLHPLYSEVTSTLARLSSRSLRHNHPTTSWHIISYSVVIKKIYARLVIMTMKPQNVSIISIVLAILELTMRVTMPYRDRFLYRKVFGPHLQGQSPFKMMTDARNRTLRAETEAIENVTDFVFIFTGVIWPWLGKVSFNGVAPASAGGLLRSACVQFAIECTLDVFVAYAIGFLQNYFTFVHSKTKTRYWGFFVATHCASPTVVLMCLVLPFALCAVDGETFDWVVCGVT
mmetsp:Transcript_75819/g.214368  ORF Transcript_75819/g.214368 Transcript_75819/m.214368 type:complete len:498 (+) Transcript_75819:39-1532(+)